MRRVAKVLHTLLSEVKIAPDGVRAAWKGDISDGAEARTLKPISGIPVGILRATPPGRMRGDSGAITRLIIQPDLDLALSAPNGILITANHVGHFVQKDDPALTVKLIAHVLEHVAIDSRK